jgi:hypothetical protein
MYSPPYWGSFVKFFVTYLSKYHHLYHQMWAIALLPCKGMWCVWDLTIFVIYLSKHHYYIRCKQQSSFEGDVLCVGRYQPFHPPTRTLLQWPAFMLLLLKLANILSPSGHRRRLGFIYLLIWFAKLLFISHFFLLLLIFYCTCAFLVGLYRGTSLSSSLFVIIIIIIYIILKVLCISGTSGKLPRVQARIGVLKGLATVLISCCRWQTVGGQKKGDWEDLEGFWKMLVKASTSHPSHR